MLGKPLSVFILTGIVAVLAGIFLLLKRQSQSSEAADSASQGSGARTEAEAMSGVNPSATKARTRELPSGDEPKMEETLAALKATLPGLTEFPEQTLQERIVATNALLKKAGIDLRFGVDETLYPSNNLSEMKVPAFSMENAKPNDILQHDSEASETGYLISEGRVLYQGR